MSTYICSDLHGCYDLWSKIKNKIGLYDTLYCLGDNIDRGANGYKICQEQAHMHNVVTLKGNHEALAAAAIPELLNNHFHFVVVQNWFINGGDITWNTLEDLSDQEILRFKSWCDNLKKYVTVINSNNEIIYLSHAGYTLGYKNLSDPLWDREHFYDNWPSEEAYPNANKSIVIHGHTPVQYLNHWLKLPTSDKPEIIKYCDNHKIDIDLGSIKSHRAALLNIDTWEVIYIE